MSSSQFLRKDSVPFSSIFVSMNQAFSLRKEEILLKNILEGRKTLRKLPQEMHKFSRHFILLMFFVSRSAVVSVKQTWKFKQLVQNIDEKFQWRRPVWYPASDRMKYEC